MWWIKTAAAHGCCYVLIPTVWLKVITSISDIRDTCSLKVCIFSSSLHAEHLESEEGSWKDSVNWYIIFWSPWKLPPPPPGAHVLTMSIVVSVGLSAGFHNNYWTNIHKTWQKDGTKNPMSLVQKRTKGQVVFHLFKMNILDFSTSFPVNDSHLENWYISVCRLMNWTEMY